MSVLVSYDGSDSAKYVLTQIADTLPTGQLTLLYVWDPPLAMFLDSSSSPAHDQELGSDAARDQSTQSARSVLEEGRAIANAYGLMVTTMITCKQSSIWETILRAADGEDSSLIVVGARPRGTAGPTRSSVSAEVLMHSLRPVLVMPMPSKQAVMTAPLHALSSG